MPANPQFIMADDAELPKRRNLMLPQPTRLKLQAIERENAKASGARKGLNERKADLARERGEVRQLLNQIDRDRGAHPQFWTPANQQNRDDLQAQFDDLSAQIKTIEAELAQPLRKLSKEEQARLGRLAKFAPDWEDFLLVQPKITRFRHFVPELKLSAKAKLADSLAEVRAQSDAILDQLVQVESARLDLGSIIAQIHADVDALASSGEPKLGNTLHYITENIAGGRGQGHVGWPRELATVDGREFQKGSSLLAWLFADELKSKLECMVRKLDPKAGLSISDKNKAIDKLEAQLLPLHRIEEALFLAASVAGHDVERRRVHPMAFLEIVKDEKAEAAERKRIDDISAERASQVRIMPDSGNLPVVGPPANNAMAIGAPKLAGK